MKDFSLKFIDIMIGIVLGLGFQWWPDLHEPWQFVAFIFVYFNIIDYWVDTSPAWKKFPPKRELDIIIDVVIMFTLFVLIYSTQRTIPYFLLSFVVFRIPDSLWLKRTKSRYSLTEKDLVFINAWLKQNILEIIVTTLLAALAYYYPIYSLYSFVIFILFRIATRISASFQYKKVFFA